MYFTQNTIELGAQETWTQNPEDIGTCTALVL